MIKHCILTKQGKTRIVKLSPLRAIRFNCLTCMGWRPSLVRKCSSQLCALYPYRLGTNPERTGIGRIFSKKVT